jgi:hypothetical protein
VRIQQGGTFLTSLSDLDNDPDNGHSSSPSSDDEFERKHEDKLTRLCFFTDSTHGDFYTMVVDFEVKASKDKVPVDNNTSEVTPSINNLIVEHDIMNDTLMSQDKLLKCTIRERKEYKDKLEIVLKELEAAKKCALVVSNEVECNQCAVHMSSLTSLQSMYVALLDENDKLKSRSGLLGVCKSCSDLQSELVEKVARISLIEKAISDITAAKCVHYEGLELEIESCRHDKMRIKEENTYL